MTEMHPAIEEAIREAIGKPEGDLTKGDFEHLTTLDLNNNQISDLTPLVQSLKDLTQLTELYLAENQISDVTPLKDLTQLTVLELSCNQISDVTPLKDLTQLILLWLYDNNQISQPDIKHLQEALPGCEIIAKIPVC